MSCISTYGVNLQCHESLWVRSLGHMNISGTFQHHKCWKHLTECIEVTLITNMATRFKLNVLPECFQTTIKNNRIHSRISHKEAIQTRICILKQLSHYSPLPPQEVWFREQNDAEQRDKAMWSNRGILQQYSE